MRSSSARYTAILVLVMVLVAIGGCGSWTGGPGGDPTHDEGAEHSEGAHDEGSEHGEGGVGEESGRALGLDEVYDAVRNGARLTLAYDPATNSFEGAVQNTTSQTLCRVRGDIIYPTIQNWGRRRPPTWHLVSR
jgi:hypothetical protein